MIFSAIAVMGSYIMLSSNSSTMYFSKNKISGYTTKLPCEIVLDGEWECGLAEVHYPLTFYNIVADKLSIIKAAEPSIQQKLAIPKGHYRKKDVINS